MKLIQCRYSSGQRVPLLDSQPRHAWGCEVAAWIAFVVVQSRGLSEKLLQLRQLRNFHCHFDSPDLIGIHPRREPLGAPSVRVGSNH